MIVLENPIHKCHRQRSISFSCIDLSVPPLYGFVFFFSCAQPIRHSAPISSGDPRRLDILRMHLSKVVSPPTPVGTKTRRSRGIERVPDLQVVRFESLTSAFFLDFSNSVGISLQRSLLTKKIRALPASAPERTQLREEASHSALFSCLISTRRRKKKYAITARRKLPFSRNLGRLGDLRFFFK